MEVQKEHKFTTKENAEAIKVLLHDLCSLGEHIQQLERRVKELEKRK